MKRTFAVLIVMIVLSLPLLAMADVDFTSMSTDELIAMKEQLMAELIDRGELKEVKVPSGEYIVGEQIPAGEYSIALADGEILAMITVNEYEQMYTLSEDSGIGRIVLVDGDAVSVMSSVVFTKFAGLGF